MKNYLKLTIVVIMIMGLGYAEQSSIDLAKSDNIDALLEKDKSGGKLDIRPKPSSLTVYPEESIDANKKGYLELVGAGCGYDGGPRGPKYTVYDLVAKEGSTNAMTEILEKRFNILSDKLDKEKYPFTYYPQGVNKEDALFPLVKIGDFYISLHGSRYDGNYGIAGVLFDNDYAGNPLATAAMHGRLDMVKAIVGWLKKTLKKLNAENRLSDYLNYPACNFGVGLTKGVFVWGGNALIFAILNKHYDIAQYLIDMGAPLIGTENSPIVEQYGKGAAVTVQPNDYPQESLIDVKKLIQDAGLKLMTEQASTEQKETTMPQALTQIQETLQETTTKPQEAQAEYQELGQEAGVTQNSPEKISQLDTSITTETPSTKPIQKISPKRVRIVRKPTSRNQTQSTNSQQRASESRTAK